MAGKKNATHGRPGILGRWPVLLVVVLASLLWAPPARANYYLFSFNASSVLSALQTSQGAAYNSDAFFGLWFQPCLVAGAGSSCTTAIVSGQDVSALTNPDSTPPDNWSTSNSFSDPSDNSYGNNTWAYFGKQANQQYVSVLSGANGGAHGNIFVPNGPGTPCSSANTTNCASWSDTGQPLVDFGNYNGGSAFLTNLINPAATISFIVNSPSALSGSYTIKGIASAINTDSTTSYDLLGTKTIQDIQFSLTVTPTFAGAPEPGSWLLMALGGGLVVVGSIRKKRRSPASSAFLR